MPALTLALHLSTLIAISASFSASAARPPAKKNCSRLAELAEGPFWVVEDILTSNIRSNLSFGVPLNLTLRVVNASSGSHRDQCVAIKNARVDIWQSRYDGLYSDEESEQTTGQTWLRGYQLTNASGYATFYTIYPGWYESRTVHIHIRVRLYRENGSTSYEETTQLYFDDAISDAIFKSVYPYNDRGGSVRDKSNSDDELFTSNNLISLIGSYRESGGYRSTVELSVPFGQAEQISTGDRSDVAQNDQLKRSRHNPVDIS